MTANRGLFVRNNGNVGTTPIEGRLVLAELVAENAPGVPRQGLLDQKDTIVVSGKSDMSYDVAACTPVLNRATSEGVYIFTLTGTTNVTTTAAPGTGSRWDLIYVKQNDPDKGDADNTATVAVLQGTAAASSPTKPTADLPAGAYVLAEALVNAGATGTNTAQVTITQTWRYTALRDAPIPVRSQAERDEITPTLGSRVRRLDKTTMSSVGALEAYNGSAWEAADSRVVATPASMVGGTVPAGVELITQMGTAVATTDGAGYARIYFPKAFPNGVVSIILSDGDGAVAQTTAGWGAGLGFSIGGSNYSAPVAKDNFVYSVWTASNGSRVINGTHRVNYIALGW